MVYYDHAMVSATLAVAVGAQRRYGWPAVVLAALAGMFPDWDASPKHLSPRAYEAGHRVWGHNLFAVTLAGAALGGLGFLIHRSRPHRPVPKPSPDPGGAGPWVALGVVVLWTHPLLDLLYCGWGRDADWPVRLLWPVIPRGYARPWIPWSDWGATLLLLVGLVGWAIARRHRQVCAAASLLIVGLYITARGALAQGGW
jgi:hypothetical protein